MVTCCRALDANVFQTQEFFSFRANGLYQLPMIPSEVARILKIWQYVFWDGIHLDQAFVNSSADEKW
jgi:hypothetical protein